MEMMRRWAINILLGIDQLGNCILGGDPDETISSRLGKLKRKHGGRIPWSRPVSKVIDFLLEKIDPNHCTDAIEHDEGSEAVLDHNGEEK